MTDQKEERSDQAWIVETMVPGEGGFFAIRHMDDSKAILQAPMLAWGHPARKI
jgi:hypothetical protein